MLNQTVELVTYWQEYIALTNAAPHSIQDFSIWLNKRVTTPLPAHIPAIPAKQPAKSLSSLLDRAVSSDDAIHWNQYIPINSRISSLVGGMYRYMVFYGRKVFQGTELTSITDFGVLAAIYVLKNPRKSEVITFTLLERTTGIEIMKRLAKHGLLDDADDVDDRRSKRVMLTDKGTTLFKAMELKLVEVGDVFVANLSDEKKQELVETLNYLNSFHRTIHSTQSNLSIPEILERNILRTAERSKKNSKTRSTD